MDTYNGTPTGMVHARTKDTSRLPQGSAAKMVKRMIESVDQNPAPNRIAMDSDAYTIICNALTEHLAALEAQKDLAFSTDLTKNAYRGTAVSCQSNAIPFDCFNHRGQTT
jgi:hypothetical protein